MEKLNPLKPEEERGIERLPSYEEVEKFIYEKGGLLLLDFFGAEKLITKSDLGGAFSETFPEVLEIQPLEKDDTVDFESFPLMAGCKKRFDRDIIETINRLLQKKDKIRILEIGAGQSYPCHHLGGRYFWASYGAPWLSRAIASLYKDRVEIYASDVLGRDKEIAIFSVDDNKRLRYATLYVEGNDPILKKTKEFFLESFGRIPYSGIEKVGDRIRAVPLERAVVENIFKGLKSVYQDNPPDVNQLDRFLDIKGGVYLRPHIDREFEKLVFGLDFIPGVDARDLKSNLPDSVKEKPFDLIIGRYLENFPLNAKGIMAPDGEFMIEWA